MLSATNCQFRWRGSLQPCVAAAKLYHETLARALAVHNLFSLRMQHPFPSVIETLENFTRSDKGTTYLYVGCLEIRDEVGGDVSS